MPYSAVIELAGELGAIGDFVCASVVLPISATERTGFTVKVVEGADAVAQAANDWLALESDRGAATPFQLMALAQAACAAHCARGETPRIVVVREHGRPVVIFPAVLSHIAGVSALRFMGDPLIQYGDVIARPGARIAALEAAWCAATAGVRVVALRKVRDDARIAPLLERTAARCTEQAAPFTDLAAPSALSARDRREITRCRRRLADIGPVAFNVLRGDDARVALHETLALKRAWLDATQRASTVIGDPVWEATLEQVAGTAAFSVARLRIGQRTAALEAGFIHDSAWYGLIGAYAADFARMSPGTVLAAELCDRYRNDGLARYDMLAPADPYKSAFAHGAVAVRDYAALRFGPDGLGRFATRMLPAARLIADRLPAAWRGRLVGRTLSAKL